MRSTEAKSGNRARPVLGESTRRSFHAQRGAVLVVSLIFLLVLTLIGVVSMQNTTLQERMARNVYDGERAFQAAEAALREGEQWVMNIDTYNPPALTTSCTAPPCVAFVYPEDNSASWWASNATEYGASGAQDIPALSQDPRYFNEYAGYDPGVTVIDHDQRAQQIGPHWYRTTAAGFGAQETTIRVLQSSVRIWKD